MIAYKLFRKLKSGELAPLFINKRQRIPLGVWLDAENHQTKGYFVYKGWHCTNKPIAPHLSLRDRVWVEVEIEDYQEIHRPMNQGGLWFLAQRLQALREI